MKQNSRHIRALIKLLQDDDPRSSSLAMAQLLSYEAELDELLASLQENRNPKLRKTSHQMQVITKNRQRRRQLARRLKDKQPDLIAGLIELHMQWYDNDSDADIIELWQSLVEQAAGYHPGHSRSLADFMRNHGFSVSESDELDAGAYCIGAVLEDLSGADFVLAAIAMSIGQHYGWKGHMAFSTRGFALLDHSHYMLIPAGNWMLRPVKGKSKYRVWTPAMILKLTAVKLFLCAAASDSIRYVHTLGQCLSNNTRKHDLSQILPFPYGAKNNSSRPGI